MDKRVSIRPGVSMLSVLRYMKYSYWHALGEFVDNSLQSFISNREALQATDGKSSPLLVSIALSNQTKGLLLYETMPRAFSALSFLGPSSPQPPHQTARDFRSSAWE